MPDHKRKLNFDLASKAEKVQPHWRIQTSRPRWSLCSDRWQWQLVQSKICFIITVVMDNWPASCAVVRPCGWQQVTTCLTSMDCKESILTSKQFTAAKGSSGMQLGIQHLNFKMCVCWDLEFLWSFYAKRPNLKQKCEKMQFLSD